MPLPALRHAPGIAAGPRHGGSRYDLLMTRRARLFDYSNDLGCRAPEPVGSAGKTLTESKGIVSLKPEL